MKITPKRIRRIVVGAAFLSAVVLAGCAAKETAAKNLVLTGEVKYQGKLVTGGKLTLIPSDTKMLPVNTQIQGDGKYSVVAPGLGDMKVTIDTESLKGMPQSDNPYGKMAPKKEGRQYKMDPAHFQKYVKIPKKYSDAKTTTLSVTITGENGGKNVKNFDLTD